MKDRSLDDFLAGSDTDADGGGAKADSADDTDAGAEAPTSDEATDDSSSDDAALATARWDPGGAECPTCGTTVERRWRADEASTEFVCTDCKEW